jgi:glycosyltransferase involved in cell wall biosynthesis
VPVVIIPVLDEAAALPSVLRTVPPGYQVIVVDNGSVDGSADIAVGLGAQVTHQPVRGFGAACWAGLAAAGPEDDVVCFMDGDGSLDPAELPKVAEPVLAGDADLVLGARRPTRYRTWPLHARVANAVIAAELRRRTGYPLHDLGPMRAAGAAKLFSLGIKDRRFGWPLEMVLRAARDEWRLAEVAVTYRPRIGKSKVTGTVRGTLQAVHDMGLVLR